MKIAESDVSSESRVVGKAEYPVFETVAEAVNDPTYGLGETKLLELLNAQIRTNAMNVVRTTMTKGPTKGFLKDEATAEIISEVASGAHPEIIGNKGALDALIAKRMSEIEERMKSKIAVAE